jgi:hypothetical protein
VDNLEKVLEKLATTEKTTLVIARELDGKMRVTSGSWEGEKVFARSEVLEVRNVDGRLHVPRERGARRKRSQHRRTLTIPDVASPSSDIWSGSTTRSLRSGR